MYIEHGRLANTFLHRCVKTENKDLRKCIRFWSLRSDSILCVKCYGYVSINMKEERNITFSCDRRNCRVTKIILRNITFLIQSVFLWNLYCVCYSLDFKISNLSNFKGDQHIQENYAKMNRRVQ